MREQQNFAYNRFENIHGNDGKNTKFLKESKYQEKLYQMDRVLRYNFKFQDYQLKFGEDKSFSDFLKGNTIFIKDIIQYFIQIIQDISSIAFSLLLNNKCGKEQIKNYISKNILENLKQFCCQLVKKFNFYKNQLNNQKPNQQISSKYAIIDNLVSEIIKFICSEFKIIVIQVFNKYPKGKLSGYSSKLESKLKKIDYRQNTQIQFLHLAKQSIVSPQVNQLNEKDYFIKHIMIFLNRVISLPRERIDFYEKNETYQQAFYKFNNRLVFIISNPNITEDTLQRQYKDIVKFLTLDLRQNQGESIKRKFQKYEQQKQEQNKNCKWLGNAKIPKNISPYKKKQIDNVQFQVESSSILRVITKWIDDIIQTFKKRQKYIRNNRYKFKDNNNQPIDLNFDQRQVLQKTAKQQWDKFCKQDETQQNNIQFVCDLLKEEELEEILYKFEPSLKLSTHIHSFMIKQTVDLLIKMFQLLHKIPKEAAKAYKHTLYKNLQIRNNYNSQKPKDVKERQSINQKEMIKQQFQQLQSVNLICNRLGDLLRSTIYCTEPEFIKLLTLLYKLNDYCFVNKLANKQNKCFFKLIRIKDKLNEITNDVLINYMFFDTIQCELQICFLSQKQKKQEATRTIHHYLYELKRGMFGVIPQLAIIVKQYDPISLNKHSSFLTFQKIPQKILKKQCIERKIFNESQSKGIFWRCINIYCNYFSVIGKYQLVFSQNKAYCLKCYTCFKQQNIYKTLQLLDYQNQDIWVKTLLQMEDQALQLLSEEQLSREDERVLNNKQEVYLMIHPTEKKVIVLLVLIYKDTYNNFFVIKPLKKKQKAKELGQSIFQQQLNKQKFFFKIKNIDSIYTFLQAEKNQGIRRQFAVSYIEKKKQQGLKQITKKIVQTEIQNKQPNLRINNQKSGWQQLLNLSKNQQIQSIQRLEADNIQVQSLSLCKKLSNIKQMSLANNTIKHWENYQNYNNLAFLDLRNNKISEILILDLTKLKIVNLNNNNLKLFDSSNLLNLTILELQENLLEGILCLSTLQKLSHLNINYNLITQLNIKDSSCLTKLYCKKRPNIDIPKSSMKIDFHKNIQLRQLISVENMLDSNFLSNDLFQKMVYLVLQVGNDNYKAAITQQFPNLKYLSLHFRDQNFMQASMLSDLTPFIIKQKNVTDIQLTFKKCKIQILDLSKLHHVQRVTVFIENELQVYFLKGLKLNSVEKLIIKAGLGIIEVDWSKVKQLTLSDVVLKEVFPLETVLENRDIEKIVIIESKFVDKFNFSNLPAVKEIDIQLKTILIPNSPYSVERFECNNNPQLKRLQLGLIVRHFQAKDCPQLQYFSLQSKYDKQIDSAYIELPKLKKLEIKLVLAKSFKLKLLASAIKEISFTTLVNFTQNLDFQLLQGIQAKIDLEELQITNRNLPKLQILLSKINSIKRVIFWLQSRNIYILLTTSKICPKMVQLRLTANFNQDPQVNKKRIIEKIKITIDTSVKIIYLPMNVRQIELQMKHVSLIYIRQSNKRKCLELTSIKLSSSSEIEDNAKSLVIFEVDNQRVVDFEKFINSSTQKVQFKIRTKSEMIINQTEESKIVSRQEQQSLQISERLQGYQKNYQYSKADS